MPASWLVVTILGFLCDRSQQGDRGQEALHKQTLAFPPSSKENPTGRALSEAGGLAWPYALPHLLVWAPACGGQSLSPCVPDAAVVPSSSS